VHDTECAPAYSLLLAHDAGTVRSPVTDAVVRPRTWPPSPGLLAPRAFAFFARVVTKGEAVVVAVWSPKGGSGTSVVAAGLGVVLSAGHGSGNARIADLTGDQPTLFGINIDPAEGLADWLAGGAVAPSDAFDRLAVRARPRLSLLPRGGDTVHLPGDEGSGAALAVALDRAPTVIDVGVPVDPAQRGVISAASTSIVVVRLCYLALRRAAREPLLSTAAGVIVVGEDHRAIRAADVSNVLGCPLLGRVRVRPSIARAVDAGLFAGRLPTDLTSPLKRALQRVGALSAFDEGAAA